MDYQRTKNAKRNSLWGLFNKFVTMLCPFLSRTVMIKTLGAEYLGLNGLFTSILSVLSLAELGFGTAIVYSMYKPAALNDTPVICALLNAYKKVYRIVGVAVLFVGCSILPFLDFMINDEVPDGINIYILFIIYLLNCVSSYWLFAYKLCLFTVHQRNDITSKIGSVLSFLLYSLQIAALILTRNYYLYIILLPIYTIISNFVCAFWAKKFYPQYVPKGEVSVQMKNDLKKSICGLMVVKITSVSRNAFDSIIISAYLGLYTVAIYNNYYYIMNSVTGILLVFTTAIAASIGNSIAVETAEKNLNDMNRLNFSYMWISGWCTSCLACLYQPFMQMWTGSGLMLPNSTMWLFVIYFIITKLVEIQAQYFDAAGLWWERKYYAIAEALANIILNFVLGYYFGVNGILIATIITMFFINFIFTSKVIFTHYFKHGRKNYILSQIYYAAISLLAAFISYSLCNYIDNTISSNILVLFINAVTCIIIPNIIFLIVYSRTKIFKETFGWLKSKLTSHPLI